jgi:hypothetical protein
MALFAAYLFMEYRYLLHLYNESFNKKANLVIAGYAVVLFPLFFRYFNSDFDYYFKVLLLVALILIAIPKNKYATRLANERLEIRSLRYGQVAYMVDWGVSCVNGNVVGIRSDYTASYAPGATSKVKIKRLKNRILIEKSTFNQDSAGDLSHFSTLPAILVDNI